MNLQEVHETTGKPLPAIKLALQDGSLHGKQDPLTGMWEITEQCVNSWVKNQKCSCRLVGESLRALRNRASLTLEEVARDAQLNLKLVKAVEAGSLAPSPAVAAKISAAIAMRLTGRNADADS